MRNGAVCHRGLSFSQTSQKFGLLSLSRTVNFRRRHKAVFVSTKFNGEGTAKVLLHRPLAVFFTVIYGRLEIMLDNFTIKKNAPPRGILKIHNVFFF